jgi:antitoxin component of MazEF toxin-antitoxin module
MVRIQQKSNGQYVVTIPKQLAEAYNIEQGQEAEWDVHSGSALKLETDP